MKEQYLVAPSVSMSQWTRMSKN